MSDKLVRIATFTAGLVVGAAMVYLSPPPVDAGPMGPPLDGPGGHPGQGEPVGPETHVGGGEQPPSQGVGPPLPGPQDGPGLAPAGEVPPPGEGPPSGDAVAPEPAGPAGPPAGGAWLETHLADAETMWTELADEAEAQGQAELASSMRELAGRAPVVGDRPPPLDQVVVFLSDERVMVDRSRAAGLDVSRVELAIGPILR